MTPPQERASGRPRIWLRLALSLMAGAALCWMLVRGGLPIVPEAGAFAGLRRSTVALYVASLLGVHFLRAARWRHLLRPIGAVPLRAVLATSWIGFAAVLFLPLRLGEVVRPWLVARRGAVRGWEAAGTVGAERVVDGLALSAILFGALELSTPLDPLPERVGALELPVRAVRGAAYGALGLFALCFALMALLYWQRERALRLVRAGAGLASQRLGARLAGIAARVADGLRFLPAARHGLPFLLETLAYWALNAAGLWLLARSCGIEPLGGLEACVVMGSLGIGILVPAGPGFFGAYQLSVYLALALYLPPERVVGPGSAFVFLSYTSQLALHALGALVGLALDRRSARNLAAPAAPA
ncbi:MAG: flippase-like domain-containing protein [Deltaproteobacteria bacterium]|nr:flippase-like domain-containing protein [Deltaproteobacteria bacterium]